MSTKSIDIFLRQVRALECLELDLMVDIYVLHLKYYIYWALGNLFISKFIKTLSLGLAFGRGYFLFW